MNVNDVISIKNRAGLLNIRIVKELSLREVTMGIGDDKLPGLPRPRLEYHKSPRGDHLITLCGDCSTTPFNMYVLHIDCYDNPPRCYLGVCDNDEADVFETVY